MFKKFLTAFSFILLVTTSASAEGTDMQNLADEMMQVAGMNDPFPHTRTHILNVKYDLSELNSEMQAKFHRALRDTVEEFFDPESMRLRVRDSLASTVSEQDMKHIIAFYSTDLGQRIVVLEKETGKPETSELIESTTPQILEKLEADGERKALLDSMEESVPLIDRIETRQFELGYAMATGMRATGQTSLDVTDDQIRSFIRQEIAKEHQNTVDHFNATMYVAYHLLAVDELERYADFHRDPEVKRIAFAYTDAVTSVLAAETFEFAKKLQARLDLENI